MSDPPDLADAVAVLLGLDLPEECREGVRANAALLAAQWAKLRDFTPPDDPA